MSLVTGDTKQLLAKDVRNNEKMCGKEGKKYKEVDDSGYKLQDD
jgi:hypothetical protein